MAAVAQSCASKSTPPPFDFFAVVSLFMQIDGDNNGTRRNCKDQLMVTLWRVPIDFAISSSLLPSASLSSNPLLHSAFPNLPDPVFLTPTPVQNSCPIRAIRDTRRARARRGRSAVQVFRLQLRPGAMHSVRITQFREDFFPQNEMNEVPRKGLCPQITQMHADAGLFFSLSASICVNLRATPDSVAAGRAALSVANSSSAAVPPMKKYFQKGP